MSTYLLLGNVLGSFIAGPLADGLGRKMGMFVANFVVITGSVVQASAYQRRDMIVGRVILGIGSVLLGILQSRLRRRTLLISSRRIGPSAQSYTVEISHPAYRGVMMGLYNGCYFIGAIVSTCKYQTWVSHDRFIIWSVSRAHLWYHRRYGRRDKLESSDGHPGDTMHHCPGVCMVLAWVTTMVDEPW